MTDRITSRCENLLKEEWTALRTGDFEKLPGLTARKDALITEFIQLAPNGAALARMTWLMDRNGKLLAARCAGIRAAAVRLAETRSVKDGLSLYTQSGQKERIDASGPLMERRA
ncbi:hypothetical protein AN189_00500 [Loktanella sp. 3ANDIMAR09]|uniref:hypothetical protein n=1 Tax=Loktanella sp. 3ANDIMAR09 TaxID=1225657 RepID=UPI0006F6BDC6|nr:hypothetical protein [Loktanella sp. 3ANDIMAR09]KQI69929.1 hypothetical protein AN189_00500 [Loktanella sp. 3ANDIMAR09]